MIYREAGQFKTTYAKDQQVFPILQDRIAVESLVLAGASPDDAARMRDYLGLPKPAGKPRKTSDELADDWRKGGYPYKYKMLRKDYEREKFILQTELLKLQQWARETDQRLVILFEGRDAILSGPAGGVVSMAQTAREAGFSRVIGFDGAPRMILSKMVPPLTCQRGIIAKSTMHHPKAMATQVPKKKKLKGRFDPFPLVTLPASIK